MPSSKRELNWICHVTGPLDFHEDSTLSVLEWLKQNPTKDALYDFLQAVAVVTREPLWVWRFRHPPRVAYDVVSDRHFFIFKLADNGIAFVVSERHMPELDS